MNKNDIFSLCPEWENDERMNVLFAPLRNKQVNPESWNSKIQFWTELITKWCSINKKASFSLEDLESVFQRNGKVPYCLKDVFQEAWNSGKMVELSRYQSSLTPRQSWGGWLVGVGVQAGQGLQDRLIGWSPDIKSRLVIPGVTDQLIKQLLEKIKKDFAEKPDVLRLKNTTFVSSEMMNDLVSDEEKELLDFLVAGGQLGKFSVNGVNFFKISSGTDIVLFDPIVDSGIVGLHQALVEVDSKVDDGEAEIKSLEVRAKELLKTGSRMSAKTILRRKKMVENKLESTLGQKLNIESLLDKIKSAETDKSVIDAYKSGYEALNVGLKDIDIEDVEQLTDDISDVIGKADSVAELLYNNQLDDTGDTEDLERELMDLSDEQINIKSNEDQELLDELEKLAVEDDSLTVIKPEDKIRQMEQL